MPSRKLLANVVNGFLGTYTSRYSDLDGYLVFGLASEVLDGVIVDLLGDTPPPSNDPAAEVCRLAVLRFAQQLAKNGLPLSILRQATLSISRQGYREIERSADGRVLRGHDYLFEVSAESDLGRVFRGQHRVFIAPHDAMAFSRSSRRGNVGVDSPAS